MVERTAGGGYAGLLIAVSFASDLNMGQSMEHGLKTTWLAMRIADHLDLGARDIEAVYYGGLLKDAG